jgi:hypothetical protein
VFSIRSTTAQAPAGLVAGSGADRTQPETAGHNRTARAGNVAPAPAPTPHNLPPAPPRRRAMTATASGFESTSERRPAPGPRRVVLPPRSPPDAGGQEAETTRRGPRPLRWDSRFVRCRPAE